MCLQSSQFKTLLLMTCHLQTSEILFWSVNYVHKFKIWFFAFCMAATINSHSWTSLTLTYLVYLESVTLYVWRSTVLKIIILYFYEELTLCNVWSLSPPCSLYASLFLYVVTIHPACLYVLKCIWLWSVYGILMLETVHWVMKWMMLHPKHIISFYTHHWPY